MTLQTDLLQPRRGLHADEAFLLRHHRCVVLTGIQDVRRTVDHRVDHSRNFIGAPLLPGSESPASAKYSQRGCHSVLAFVLPLYVRQHCLDLLPLTQETDTTEAGPFNSRRAVVSGSLSMSLWQMEQVYLFGMPLVSRVGSRQPMVCRPCLCLRDKSSP